ncbi:XrtA/PEP-CTERM system histidine kinase PrsK [Sphingosinicella rhizophila]|uniref:histidine kinase n=1 Tax=Sphingosinicella rhizophila TaxID=3050082 RepID=A0ABU3Q711_9SPHN|nr:XrtA/PEP-CTERM system histidine kinase PrsK [Sphingosinicella sp. GR2756]MDT9599175.1 PEP-CTERM system histidine kinase PrsK [Sphingosinicella sp. GR2756]
MVALIGFWSHALAAILFGVLAVWQLRHWNLRHGNRQLVGAFAITSAWAIFVAMLGSNDILSGLAESGRNFAFLAFMYAIVRGAAEDERQKAVKPVYATVAGVIGFQITIAGVLPEFAGNPIIYQALLSTKQIIGLTIAAGSLVLVHNLYGQAARDSRWAIGMPALALAAMWIYDIHLYTTAYLTRSPAEDLFAMRGAIMAMIVPLFALASRRNTQWRVHISRAATFQSISVIAILSYLILMMSATRAMEIIGGDWVRIGQIGLVLAMTITAGILLPSGRLRAWLRVILSKHLFEHRYDYRQEWLRFTRTIGLAGESQAPLDERIVKAMADIADSPGGLLLVPDDHGRLAIGARWNWHLQTPPGTVGDAALIRFLETSAHIIDFDTAAGARQDGKAVAIQDGLRAFGSAWAGVPLLHNDRLVGLVVLDHPLVRRPLDWEDFDLFRTAGIQAASYLAEARGQEALANVQRFDEFNRRFAFIIHDIKNLVSQLALVARNAERHADNPEFRADMIATLQGSVKKMNDLLARLSRGNNVEAEAPRPIRVADIVAAVAETRKRAHRIEIKGEADLVAIADPVRLEQALEHLVQNAIDASPAGRPVTLYHDQRGGEVAIDIIDRGTGMSADFVRTRLFQPFASTKDDGFGVGAFEARTLVATMGGRIEVESRVGEGSRFTVFLPLGETKASPGYQRMSA